MKARVVSVFLAMFVLAHPLLAQESPASREDILKLLDLLKTRDMTRQMMQSTSAQVRAQMLSIMRNSAPGVPDEFFARIDSIVEALVTEMVSEYPTEEILEDIIPVYQKYLTSADVNAMIAFYSTPTGQKFIREMPAIMAESMQASQPRINRQMESLSQKMQQAIRQLIEEFPRRPAKEL
jgi:uncharacterized protein